MFTYICITDGADYSRITLRFSITRIKPPTTDFPPVSDDLRKVVRVNAKQTDTRRYTCKMRGLECSGCSECKVSVLSQELKNVRHVSYQAETHVSPSWDACLTKLQNVSFLWSRHQTCYTVRFKNCPVFYLANNHLAGVDWIWTLDYHQAVWNNIVLWQIFCQLNVSTEVNGGSV